MTTAVQKCSVCRAILDEEDLFCANCGTEAPSQNGQPTASNPDTVVATHNFLCDGCGAGMSYDASAQNLRCPFCGGEKLTEVKDAKVLAPDRVVPFKINQRDAHAILQKWLPSSFWRPSDLAQQSVVEKMTPVFVPYWVFSAQTYTYWTADTSQTPMGARGNWFPMSGNHRGQYQGLLIGASGSLTPGETSALCPFDLREGVPPEQVDLNNVVYEPFQVQRKYARPLAQRGFEDLIARDCRQYVPGNCRKLKVNVRVEDLLGEPVLLPVFIMAYRYKGHVYRFLVNGQTGRHTGTAPTSYFKIAGAVGIAILVIVAIVVCMGLAAAIMGR